MLQEKIRNDIINLDIKIKNMKKLNYYQVHKNKKPKVVFEQQHKYVKKMLFMAKKSFYFRNSLQSFIYSMDVFSEISQKIVTPKQQ